MRVARLPILWFTASLFLGGAGCELVAQVDRSQIGGTGTTGGGEGGSGGATSSTASTATASSTGGSGGEGGSGGATSSTGTGGEGGAGGGTSASSSSGTGGGTPCTTASECPATGSECVAATCNAGVCDTVNVAAGTATTTQTVGDCKQNECDGNGAITAANLDTDLKDDSNPCTIDACAAGVPTHAPAMMGLVCGTNQVCDGAGLCVGCVTAATCPGQDDECKARTCTTGVCGFSFTAAGTATAAQTGADCKKNQCDGAGAIVSVADNADVPVDSKQCTSDVCTAGAPSNPPLAAGSACTENSGTQCNGAGLCVQCITAATCPGTDTACHARTCTAGVCGVSNVAAGTVTATQATGDCKQNECDGNGAIVAVNNDTDLPVDNNLCTSDVCTAGAPSNPPTAAGTSCGAGITCDGAGTCLGCNTGADCPGTDTECHTRTCTVGVCGVANAAAGTVTTTQATGDCKQNECDGSGAIVAANHDADVPNDGAQCTSDTCTAGVPSNSPVAIGTACTQNGGTLCNAVGACVACNAATDCPGSDSDCQIRTCTAGACGVFNTAAGNPTSTQTAGNCQVNQCDGNGAAVNVADNADLPVDSKQCTSDVCTAGVPSNPALPAGTACTQSGGTICDGAGACTTSSTTSTDFTVLRIGDGTAALSNASTAGFLEHRLIDGSTASATLSLPIAASGANKPLTFSGSATSEGALSRSDDGHYLTLAGYAAAPGVASVSGTTSAATNRVIGRINASGDIDTSTLITAAFSANNIRAAATSDGTSFWAVGGNSAVQYLLLGQSTATQVNTAPTNIRTVNVFGGQLYGTSGSGLFVNVFSIGTGLPTTTGQTATSFAGMPTATASPYAFALLDHNPAVAGVDTLYVADDRAVASGGGIQKWTYNGTTWTLAATFTQGANGFRGVAGVVTGNNVTVIGTTALASANAVVVFVDDGVTTPTGAVVATAPTNTAYRGIAFAPK